MRKQLFWFLGGCVFASLLAALFLLVWPAGEKDDAGRVQRDAPPPPVAVAQQPIGAARQEPERALTVGVIGPESGEEAAYGLQVLNGVLLAAERFNEDGGIDGKPIEVLHYDNEGRPDRTLEIAQQLIESQVVAILSAPTGWSSFGPTHMADATSTIFISVGTRRRLGGRRGYVFHYGLSDELATDDLVRYAIEVAGYRNYALVTSSAHDNSLALSSSFKQAILRKGGAIVVDADTYDTFSGATNLDAVVEALGKSPTPPDAVIFTGGDGQAARLVRAAREAGLAMPFLGGEDMFTAKFLDEAGEAGLGTLLFATFSPHDARPDVVDFIARHRRRTGGPPDRFAALAYDAFSQLAEAIRRAGSTRSAAVREAMTSRKDAEGVTGRTNWADRGTPLKNSFIHRVEAGEAGPEFVLLKWLRNKPE